MVKTETPDRCDERGSVKASISSEEITHLPDKKAVSLLSAGHLMADSYGGFIYPIMPFIAAKLGITLGLVGTLLSISHLSSSILQPVFGYISDSSNRRFFIICGLLLSAIFMSLSGVVNNAWWLGIVLFIGSLGVGFYHPQATSLAGHFSGRDINKLMGIFTACGTIGYAVGPMMSSSLVENFGLNSTAIAMIPGIALAYLVYKTLPKIAVKIENKKAASFVSMCKTVSSNKTLLLLTIISIIKALMVMSFTVLMPFVWKEHNYSVMIIGLTLGLFSTAGGLASYLGGRLADKIGRKPVFLLSLIPATPGLLGTLYLLDKMPYLSFALFVMAGFSLMLSVSVNLVMAQMAVPENKGMVSGIIGGLSWGLVGISLSPLGFMATTFGILPVLTIISIIPLFGVIAALLLPKELN